MEQIHKDRLRNHILFMAGVPDEGIIMSSFYGTFDDDGVMIPGGGQPLKQDASCKTAACTAGWLPVQDPANWHVKECCPRLIGSTVNNTAQPGFHNVFADVATYFGITYEQANMICAPDSYDTEEDCEPLKAEVLEHMLIVARAYGMEVTLPEAT